MPWGKSRNCLNQSAWAWPYSSIACPELDSGSSQPSAPLMTAHRTCPGLRSGGDHEDVKQAVSKVGTARVTDRGKMIQQSNGRWFFHRLLCSRFEGLSYEMTRDNLQKRWQCSYALTLLGSPGYVTTCSRPSSITKARSLGQQGGDWSAQKIITACQQGQTTWRAITELFGVCVSFVEKLLQRYRTTGTFAAKPHGFQKRRLDATADQRIRADTGPTRHDLGRPAKQNVPRTRHQPQLGTSVATPDQVRGRL